MNGREGRVYHVSNVYHMFLIRKSQRICGPMVCGFKMRKMLIPPPFALLHWFMFLRYAVLLDPRSQGVGGKLQVVEVKEYETHSAYR